MDFRPFKPDVRILILQIILSGLLGFSFDSEAAVIALFFIVDLLILRWYGIKLFWKRLLTYAVMYGIVILLTAVRIPVLSLIFPPFLLMAVRIFPAYLLLRLLVDKAPMDELLYAMERLHVSKSLSIPLMVVYRYVPTILQEIRCIHESLKMRGMNLSLSNFGHLIRTLENYVVPLLFRSEKIAEELSAASLCKGLSAGRRRTCCTDVRLNAADFVYLVLMAAVICGLYFLDGLNWQWR